MKMRKVTLLILMVLVCVCVMGCGTNKTVEESKNIKIGATAGPYSDQINGSIKEILENSGYHVEIIEFNDYVQPNKSLNEGDIDANVYQNQLYLDNFNEEHDMDLVSILAVPTAPIGLYSENVTEISEIKDNMKVTLPNDPVNMARALLMMEEFGWITFDETIDPNLASDKDIVENYYDLDIVPLEAAQVPHSLDDVDLEFINVNVALSSGLTLEERSEEHTSELQSRGQ